MCDIHVKLKRKQLASPRTPHSRHIDSHPILNRIPDNKSVEAECLRLEACWGEDSEPSFLLTSTAYRHIFHASHTSLACDRRQNSPNEGTSKPPRFVLRWRYSKHDEEDNPNFALGFQQPFATHFRHSGRQRSRLYQRTDTLEERQRRGSNGAGQ